MTHRGFQNETASYRLSEFISQLRHRHHWEIVTHERHGKTQDPTGRWVDYGVYEIPAAVLLEIRAEIGERVEAFIKSVEAFEARGVRSV